jgi:outer membrane immunogenic protein
MNYVRLPIAGMALGIAAAVSFPALAQDRDSHFDGAYVQGFGGYAARGSDNGTSLVFDKNADGDYNDTVTLPVTGANAFSPGFCDGQAIGPRPTNGCKSDEGNVEYGVRFGYDRRMNNFVLGGLVEASKNQTIDTTSGFSTTPASYALQRELDYNI